MTTSNYGNGDYLSLNLPPIDDQTFILGNGVGDNVMLGFLENAQDLISSSDTIILGNGNGDLVTLFNVMNTNVTLGNGAGDTVLDNSAGDKALSGNVFNLGKGDGDTVKLGNHAITNAVVSLGGGNGDSVEANNTSNSAITLGDGDNDIVTIVDIFNHFPYPDILSVNNTITLGNGNNDTVFGGGWNTIILGNGNNDTVFSGVGFNTITVGNGNDTIHVEFNDTVTVGNGSDSFLFDDPIFENQPGGIGAVTINGFNPGKDVIVIQKTLATTFNASDDSHGNAVITFPGDTQDTISLVGVHSSALLLSDFQFV